MNNTDSHAVGILTLIILGILCIRFFPKELFKKWFSEYWGSVVLLLLLAIILIALGK